MIEALFLLAATATNWELECRVMRPMWRDHEQVGNLVLKFSKDEGETLLEVVSQDFPDFRAGAQPVKFAAVTDVGPAIEDHWGYQVWQVDTESGRYAFETTRHSSRNGAGFGILISSYEMTTVGSLPEDFFRYHAVGLCSRVRDPE